MKRWLADRLTAIAIALYPSARLFDPDADDLMDSPEKWCGLLVLHLEAVHGCEHTDQVRRALGLVGPRGERA